MCFYILKNMGFIHQRITIVRTTKPSSESINEQLQWFGASLGLFNFRDKDKSCFRIFIELVKASKKRGPISSDELAEKLNLSRGTIIHHIKKLMASGIVVSDRNKYMLRESNLSVLIDEIEKDIIRSCSDLKEVSAEIERGINFG